MSCIRYLSIERATYLRDSVSLNSSGIQPASVRIVVPVWQISFNIPILLPIMILETLETYFRGPHDPSTLHKRLPHHSYDLKLLLMAHTSEQMCREVRPYFGDDVRVVERGEVHDDAHVPAGFKGRGGEGGDGGEEGGA
jgi:hypothetical protein